MLKDWTAERLLIITDDPAVRFEGNIFSLNSANLFFLELSKLFSYSCISMPIKDITTYDKCYPHMLTPPCRGIEISERKFYSSKWDVLTNPIIFIQNTVSLFKDILKANIILYRIPSALLPTILPLLLLFKKKKDIFIFIAGDLYGRNVSTQNASLKNKLINWLVTIYDYLERRAAFHFRTIANGKALAQKFSAEIFDITLIPSNKIISVPKKFDENEIKILYVGRLDSNKAIDILLFAISELDEDIKSRIKTIIVGGGPEKKKLKELVKTLHISHIVDFKGSVPFEKVEQYYVEGNIFVLTSYSEGTTKVVYEAMAYGLAIISTEVGGIPYLNEDGECVYLVSPGNPLSVRDAITRIITDENLRLKLITNGIRKISNNAIEKKLAFLEKFLKGQSYDQIN